MAIRIPLTLACWNYDRTLPLLEGRVVADGIALNYLNLPVEETFFRMLRYHEFDAAEMSLSSYAMSLFQDPQPFVAIPIFTSRAFRHSCIYINAASGIKTPQDLIGKRVGNAEFQMTALVWIRGILAEHYQVPVSAVDYFTGGQEQTGRTEKIPLKLPPEIRVQRIGPTQTLSAMLAEGGLDAMYTARIPSSFVAETGRVQRLFPNYPQVERSYFEQSRIFPIMHTVVIRREVYEKNRWIAQSLTKAFAAAQREAYEDLYETAALKAMLPWLTAHVEDARQLMGRDYWPYGLDANRAVIETFLRYSHEQGLSPRRLEPEQLFAPETLTTFRI